MITRKSNKEERYRKKISESFCYRTFHSIVLLFLYFFKYKKIKEKNKKKKCEFYTLLFDGIQENEDPIV